MDKLERDLLAKIAALPAGEKMPVSRIARDLNCSSSVIFAGVAALVMCGALVEETMRPPVAEVKPTRDRHAYADTLNGLTLIAELKPFLDATGMPPTTLTKLALGDPGAWRRWREGKSVRMTTVKRVRAFVAANASASDSTLVEETPAGRDTATGEAAPVPGAGDEAGATVARCNPVASADRPSGQELYNEILRFTGGDSGLTLREFAEIMGRSVSGIANIAKAAWPKADTVERVRAIIAGDRTPHVSTGRLAPQSYSAENTDAASQLRVQAEDARAKRLPGETLADAVKREAEDAGRQRANAYKPGGGVGDPVESHRQRFARLAAEVEAEAEEADAKDREALRERELDELVSPSSVLRRAQRDWPGQCERVKAIAAELEITLGEAWRRVIGAGVDCMSECEA